MQLARGIAACDVDIPIDIYKVLANSLDPHWTTFLGLSCDCSILARVPDKWLKSRGAMVIEKGDLTLAAHYWPICLAVAGAGLEESF